MTQVSVAGQNIGVVELTRPEMAGLLAELP
jgi:hypothetical protein